MWKHVDTNLDFCGCELLSMLSLCDIIVHVSVHFVWRAVGYCTIDIARADVKIISPSLAHDRLSARYNVKIILYRSKQAQALACPTSLLFAPVASPHSNNKPTKAAKSRRRAGEVQVSRKTSRCRESKLNGMLRWVAQP